MGIPPANKVYGHTFIITNKKISKEAFRSAYIWLNLIGNAGAKLLFEAA
jgi:hypothetical protein